MSNIHSSQSVLIMHLNRARLGEETKSNRPAGVSEMQQSLIIFVISLLYFSHFLCNFLKCSIGVQYYFINGRIVQMKRTFSLATTVQRFFATHTLSDLFLNSNS